MPDNAVEHASAACEVPPMPRKRPYATPELQLLGAVCEMTAGGSTRLGIESDPFGCDNISVGPLGPCPKP